MYRRASSRKKQQQQQQTKKMSAPDDEYIRINIGHCYFYTIARKSLALLPRSSRLYQIATHTTKDMTSDLASSLRKYRDDYDVSSSEFYFARQTSSLHVLRAIFTRHIDSDAMCCPVEFRDEMRYWLGIDEPSAYLLSCCAMRYKEKLKEVLLEKQFVDKVLASKQTRQNIHEKNAMGIRHFIWDLFEQPWATWPAIALSLLSIFCILLNSFINIFGSLNIFKVSKKKRRKKKSRVWEDSNLQSPDS